MDSLARIIPFILFGLGAVFTLHFLFYRSVVLFFGVVRPRTKIILLTSLFLLANLFLAAMFLAEKFEGFWAEVFYVSGLGWIGVLINLLLAALLIWVLARLLRSFDFNFDLAFLAGAVFLISLIFSASGFWNAFSPRVKEIPIILANLPDEWKGGRIVQLSDVHLGKIYGPKFMEKIAAEVNAQEPDLILITGDLFDGLDDGNLERFVEPLKRLSAKKGIFFVTGNHEVYLGLAGAENILAGAGIRILNDEFVAIDGLQIVGIGYPGRELEITGRSKNTQEIILSLAGFDKARPSILLHHAPTNIEQAKTAGISLQLSGHTHLGQLFPFNLITRAVYGPYHYGLHTEGNFSVYTTNGQGTWGPPMRTFNRPEIPVFILE